MKLTLLASIIISVACATGAQAQDIKAGQKVFKKCAACHFIDKEKNKIGPHLVGIIGRPAGSIEGFKYSKALRAKADEGLVWSVEDITEYVTKPRAKIKGTKMSFAGLRKEKDRENLIAFLKSQASE